MLLQTPITGTAFYGKNILPSHFSGAAVSKLQEQIHSSYNCKMHGQTMSLKILKARMDSDNQSDLLHRSGQRMSLFLVHIQ